MTDLANAVLPLIRTRSDLYRWSAANAHGQQMHEAVDILEASTATTEPAEVYSVTHKALASAIKVIARADDSSGIVGDACGHGMKATLPPNWRKGTAGDHSSTTPPFVAPMVNAACRSPRSSWCCGANARLVTTNGAGGAPRPDRSSPSPATAQRASTRATSS